MTRNANRQGYRYEELELGMLEGSADIAVHSMKDVPVDFPDGLGLAVILNGATAPAPPPRPGARTLER